MEDNRGMLEYCVIEILEGQGVKCIVCDSGVPQFIPVAHRSRSSIFESATVSFISNFEIANFKSTFYAIPIRFWDKISFNIKMRLFNFFQRELESFLTEYSNCGMLFHHKSLYRPKILLYGEEIIVRQKVDCKILWKSSQSVNKKVSFTIVLLLFFNNTVNSNSIHSLNLDKVNRNKCYTSTDCCKLTARPWGRRYERVKQC